MTNGINMSVASVNRNHAKSVHVPQHSGSLQRGRVIGSTTGRVR
jgi:hypothetical protein